MKRKMLFGLFLAVMTLALAGCKQPEEDPGTAPILDEVFFVAQNAKIETTSLQTLYDNNRITTIPAKGKGTIIVAITDPDKDVTKLELTPTDDFNDGYYWNIHSDEYEKWYIDVYFNFDKLSSNDKAFFVNNVSSLKFRVSDAKGNVSETYILDNLAFIY